MLSCDTPKNVCLCQYHDNMELLLALHNVFPGDFPLRTYELVANCVCDDTSYECMSNNCDICKDFNLFDEFLEPRNCYSVLSMANC